MRFRRICSDIVQRLNYKEKEVIRVRDFIEYRRIIGEVFDIE